MSLPWAQFGGCSGFVNWMQHEFRQCCRSSFSSPDLSKLITVQLSESPLYWSFGQRHRCSLCTEKFELSRFSAPSFRRMLWWPVCVSIWTGRWKKSYALWCVSRVLPSPLARLFLYHFHLNIMSDLWPERSETLALDKRASVYSFRLIYMLTLRS